MENWQDLKKDQREEFISRLKERFEEAMDLHPGLSWDQVVEKIGDREEIFRDLYFMEATGGQPNLVTGLIEGKWVFVDTALEAPKERVSLCYDQEALLGRKKNPPRGSALGQVEKTGLSLLDQESYRKLQEVFPFDLKTSSWIQTPEEIRTLGGALFCHRRYNQVFVFHNGADSYYASRGFRLMIVL